MPKSAKAIPVGNGLEHPSGTVIGPFERCSLEHLFDALIRASLDEDGPLLGTHGFLPWRTSSGDQLGFCRSFDPFVLGENLAVWSDKAMHEELLVQVFRNLCGQFLWDVEICQGDDQILIFARNELLAKSNEFRRYGDKGPIYPKSVLAWEDNSFVFLDPEDDGYPSAK